MHWFDQFRQWEIDYPWEKKEKTGVMERDFVRK